VIRSSALFIAAFAWCGAALGACAVIALAHVNPSIDELRDLLVVGGYLAAIYAAVFGALGCAVLAAAILTKRLRREPTTAPFGFGAGHVALLAAASAFAVGYAATSPLDQTPLRFWLRAAVVLASIPCGAWAGLSPFASVRGKQLALVYAAAVLIAVPVFARYAISHGRLHVEASAAPAGREVPDPSPSAATAQAVVAGDRRRVFLIGIDGMDWRRIDSLRARGLLPNFDRLIRHGVRSPMHTFLPTWSPILWTTIATGVSADVHGVHDFTETPIPGLNCGLQRLRKSMLVPEHIGLTRGLDALFARGLLREVPITACQRHVEALWNILSAQQKRVAVVNWFASWPAEPVNGSLISDRNAQRAAFFAARRDQECAVAEHITYPEDLLQTLGPVDVPELGNDASEILSLPFFAELRRDEREQLSAQPALMRMFKYLYQSDEFASTAALKLLEREPVDFLAVYMSGIDNISHPFGANTGVIDRYYQFVDTALGALIAHADANTSLLVISDHGWEYENKQAYAHEHGPDGVFIATGPETPHGVTLPRIPRLHDVAPTTLALLGYLKPSWMEGEVINGVVTAPQAGRRLALSGRPYVAPTVHGGVPGTRDAETMDKLRALGYVQ
jgi:hypothetical protein